MSLLKRAENRVYKRSSINQKAGDHVSTPPPTSPFFLLYCRFGRLSDAKCPRPDVRFSQFIFGSQIINLNYRFCHNSFFFFFLFFCCCCCCCCCLLPSPTFILFYRNSHGTASVSLEFFFSFLFFSFLPPMEYSPSVKEASTKVIVAKTVIIINHSAARAKSG